MLDTGDQRFLGLVGKDMTLKKSWRAADIFDLSYRMTIIMNNSTV